MSANTRAKAHPRHGDPGAPGPLPGRFTDLGSEDWMGLDLQGARRAPRGSAGRGSKADPWLPWGAPGPTDGGTGTAAE